MTREPEVERLIDRLTELSGFHRDAVAKIVDDMFRKMFDQLIEQAKKAFLEGNGGLLKQPPKPSVSTGEYVIPRRQAERLAARSIRKKRK